MVEMSRSKVILESENEYLKRRVRELEFANGSKITTVESKENIRGARSKFIYRAKPNVVFLIVGQSGSGKSTIVEELEQRGYVGLQSYTTRAPRYEGERGHTFVSEERYAEAKAMGEIVAYTFFDENHYFCTKEQLGESDLYVIDPDGVEFLLNQSLPQKFVVIYINVEESNRIFRMKQRGDSEERIKSRLLNDAEKFKNLICDYVIPNNDLNKAVEIVERIIEIESWEEE